MAKHSGDSFPAGFETNPIVYLLATDLVELEADLYKAREENAALRSQLQSLREALKCATHSTMQQRRRFDASSPTGGETL